MNLNKQLQKVVLGECENGKKFTLGIPETENETKICVEIAENFAKGFAEWMSGLISSNYKSGGNWFVKGDIKTTDELLEIYKKTLE